MNSRFIWLLVFVFVAFSAFAQKKNSWSASFAVALNSPLVNDADTTQNIVYLDEWGFPRPGTATTKGYLLVPPLSLDVRYNVSPRLSVGVNALYQAHTEKTVVRTRTSALFVSESQLTQNAFLFFAGATYAWYNQPPFRLSSGAGMGYGFTTSTNASSANADNFCFDLRLITMNYALCCGWSLLIDGRYSSSPTGLSNMAGYTMGVGVAYTFSE